jgi:hypothetical protein
MTAFNTIHVFAYGSSQFISEPDVSKQTPNSGLSHLGAFVDHVKAFKPEDVTMTDYHVIHIFNNYEVKYLGTGARGQKDSWTVKWSELDVTLVGNLVDEIASK